MRLVARAGLATRGIRRAVSRRASRRVGPCSGSSSRTTSPQTGRRSRTTTMRRFCGTRGARVWIWSACTATVGEERTRTLLQDGPRFFQPDGTVSIPFEFADAAYRFGHSQMRGAYRVQRGGADLTLFPDLIGFRPVTSDRVIDWSLLFDVAGEPAAARSRPIDGCLAEPLLN